MIEADNGIDLSILKLRSVPSALADGEHSERGIIVIVIEVSIAAGAWGEGRIIASF